MHEKLLTEQTKLICSFINPEAASKVFKDEVVVVSDSFEQAILERDPGFDMKTFKNMMGDE